MTAEPTLGVMTKLRLGAFAADTAASHPAQARTIMTLQDTLEQRLPLAVQNQIIEKLNRDPKGTLAAAKILIDKDPKILDDVNKNPLKLATIMGVTPAAAPAAPTPVAVAKIADTAPMPAAAVSSPKVAKPVEPKAVEPVVVAAAPVAPKAAVVISDNEFAARNKLAAESINITKMAGFEEFAARAEKSQSLGKAVDAMMGKNAGSAQEEMKALQDIQQDREFFVKANKDIDQIPPQMRESVFTQIAEKPELGRQALGGDNGAKMNLMMSSMMGGKGLGEMFAPGGEGLGGILKMLASLLPMLMGGMQQAMGNIFKGNEKFADAPGVMKMGGDGSQLARYGDTVGRTLGVDTTAKLVVDGANPDQEPQTLGALNKPKVGAPAPDAKAPDTKKIPALDEPRSPALGYNN